MRASRSKKRNLDCIELQRLESTQSPRYMPEALLEQCTEIESSNQDHLIN
jgi:hypothetical protein